MEGKPDFALLAFLHLSEKAAAQRFFLQETEALGLTGYGSATNLRSSCCYENAFQRFARCDQTRGCVDPEQGSCMISEWRCVQSHGGVIVSAGVRSVCLVTVPGS